MTPIFTTDDARQGLAAAMTKVAGRQLPQEELVADFHRARAAAIHEDLVKIAAEVSDPVFLDGFAARCVAAGMTEEEMFKSAAPLLAAITMSELPDFTRELGLRLSPVCPA